LLRSKRYSVCGCHIPRVIFTSRRYAIIDDEDDELDELPLFQPSALTGLTRQITISIEKYLNGKTDKTMRANQFVRLGQNIHSLFKRDKS
jgi:hypothetical protein